MDQPAEDLAAAFDAAIPDDSRVVRKKMFGMPAAFVNRQMFFGTFGATVVARVGPERSKILGEAPGSRVFTPQEGRTWADYVQVDADSGADLKALGAEALAWTEKLPLKAVKPVKERVRKG